MAYSLKGPRLARRYGEAPTASQVKEFIDVSNHFFKDHEGELVGGCV